MTVTRHGRLKRAAALAPLALLSAAWTISISTTGAPQAAAGDAQQQRLPDGTTVPADALEVPASVTVTGGSTLGATGAGPAQIVSTSSTAGIPAAALAAYQRAETVINRADRSCRLPWQLVAAIGRVESDHGRANGNALSTAGVSTPGVYGVALDGAGGTTRIDDTDGGRYDGDTRFDRAVGPMQFIPSTWSTVGVDADGDGQRNPQDVDDAALAAAVYLCSGDDDLSTAGGQSGAVYRYNHSSSYVATVLAVMRSYADGDFTTAPNTSLPAATFLPDAAGATSVKQARRHPGRKAHGAAAPGGTSGSATSSTPTTSVKPGTPSQPKPTAPKPSAPVATAKPAVPAPTLPPPPSTGVQPVDNVLSLAEATAQCTIDLGVNNLPNPLGLDLTALLKSVGLLDEWNACITKYTT